MTLQYPLLLPSSQHELLTLSHPSSSVWVIELHNGADSRLTRAFILDVILPALDHVERAWRAQGRGDGGLVITGNQGQDKFFSNGLDLHSALAEPGFWTNVFYPLMDRVLTFPLPTVAAINGHAFAGGWLIAAACDYRVMSAGKCWGSMPEIYLGSEFPYALIVLLRTKVPDTLLLRRQNLEGERWTPQELFAAKMVDEIVDGGSGAVLKRAIEIAEASAGSAGTGVYGLIKRGLYRRVVEAGEMNRRVVTPEEDDEAAQRRLARARL